MARISTHPLQVFLALGMAVGLSAAATTPTTIRNSWRCAAGAWPR